MTTRLHISSQPEKVTTCFVLTVFSDDSGTLADTADQNVLLPKESTGQTFLTPTAPIASTAVDTRTENISGVCAVDHDDEPWLTETDYKSGWGHNIQKWSVSWYVERSCFARLSGKGRATDRTKERVEKYS